MELNRFIWFVAVCALAGFGAVLIHPAVILGMMVGIVMSELRRISEE